MRLAIEAVDVVEQRGDLGSEADVRLDAEHPLPGIERVLEIGSEERQRRIVESGVRLEDRVEQRGRGGLVATHDEPLITRHHLDRDAGRVISPNGDVRERARILHRLVEAAEVECAAPGEVVDDQVVRCAPLRTLDGDRRELARERRRIELLVRIGDEPESSDLGFLDRVRLAAALERERAGRAGTDRSAVTADDRVHDASPSSSCTSIGNVFLAVVCVCCATQSRSSRSPASR